VIVVQHLPSDGGRGARPPPAGRRWVQGRDGGRGAGPLPPPPAHRQSPPPKSAVEGRRGGGTEEKPAVATPMEEKAYTHSLTGRGSLPTFFCPSLFGNIFRRNSETQKLNTSLGDDFQFSLKKPHKKDGRIFRYHRRVPFFKKSVKSLPGGKVTRGDRGTETMNMRTLPSAFKKR